jgi:hypothetical protein
MAGPTMRQDPVLRRHHRGLRSGGAIASSGSCSPGNTSAARERAPENCRAHESARRNWWEDHHVVSQRLRTSPESLRSARDPRSTALRPSNPAPGTVPRIAPRCGLAVRTCPFGHDEMYPPGPSGHNSLIHELRPNRRWLIPEFPADVDGMWTATGATSMQYGRGVDSFDGRWVDGTIPGATGIGE